jgi:hypothetical protein
MYIHIYFTFQIVAIRKSKDPHYYLQKQINLVYEKTYLVCFAAGASILPLPMYVRTYVHTYVHKTFCNQTHATKKYYEWPSRHGAVDFAFLSGTEDRGSNPARV